MTEVGKPAGAEVAAEKETGRLEAFSDGVFAIAITLLILEIKVPPQDAPLGPALAEHWPSYLAFLTSFATIGIMWMNHHLLFMLIRRVDYTVLLLNGLVLLGVTIVPFPTALVAEHLGHPGAQLAALVYSLVYVFVGVAFQLLWRYASSPRRTPPVLGVPLDDPRVLQVHARYRLGPIGYVSAALIAPWSGAASLALNAALALWFALPHRPRA